MPIEDTVVLAMRMVGVTSYNARVSTVVLNGREMIHTIVDTMSDDVALVHVRFIDAITSKLTIIGVHDLTKGL